MKRIPFVILISSGLIFAAALVGYAFFNWHPATLRIAVGPPGSEDVKVVQDIAEAFTRERHYVRLRVVVTAGAMESVATIGSRRADLAVVRADLNLPADALSVAIFRKDVVVVWIPNAPNAKGQKKQSSIKKIEDLAGHRVGVIGKSEANVNLLKMILTESGVAPEKVGIVQFAVGEVGEALRNEKVDAFLAVGPVDSKITADALNITTKASISPTFLPITAAEIIARKHPVYESSEIAAGALGASPARPDDDVTTLGVNHLIVARKQIGDQTVTEFTKQLFAIRHMLQTDFPGVANIQVPDTDKAAAIPAHPGAAAYIDGTERTFMERYSDFFWFGLMGVSGLASLGAWFRSYMRRGDRDRNTQLRSRLVEMISAVRNSSSVDELDAMQREADDILRNTLDCFQIGAVDEDTLSAFSLALEQFHSAVTDRKNWIANILPPRKGAEEKSPS